MVEQQTQSGTMKVYELAKELGVDSISLLDKLAGLNIKVKNHMSDLGEEDLRVARESLSKKDEKKAPAKKATVTRKKKAEPTEDAPAGASVTAPVAKKTTTRKAAAPAPAAEPASEAPKSGAPVIRRRMKSTDEGEVAVSQVVSKKTAAELAAEAQAAEEAAQLAAHEAEAQIGQEIEASAAPESSSSMEPETPVSAASETPAEDVPADTAGAEPKKPAIAPIVRPTAIRKSFLKIVEASAPAPKPRIIAQPTPTSGRSPVQPAGVRGTPGGADKDGFRIIRMTKENLDQMAEEENAKKKGGGGRIEGEIKPEDVRFADYRKKEIVFLPKKKRIPVGRELKRTEKTVAAAHKRVVEMGDTITVADLASQMSVKAGDVVKRLMMMGTMATMNQSIDFDTATLVAAEFKHEVKNIAFKEEQVLEANVDTEDQLLPRPPVVTIMGHVDHGKTSLLDAIRSANVASGEAGGITQHIGAYTVEKNGKLISFIDTPGHEAFTAMRARGANVTDIVILVVAADDAVMPQTREALSHAKAAGVPIIVAVNKMDKPGANPERVKQQLAELDLLAEDWGGQTMFVPVSALKKTGLPELLEGILLQAEVLDLKANPNAKATGTVLEARLEKGRGPVASVLVKRGTLRVGDYITSGLFMGKVKALTNDKGSPVKECLPGIAVEVLGFEGLPLAGEKFDCVDTDQAAQELVENRKLKAMAEKAAQSRVSLDDLFAKSQAGAAKELNIVLKADVSGSVEAVKDSLLKLSTDKIKVKVLFAAPGGITESDVLLATASQAIILGFNVRPETKARQIAEAEHVEIKCYNIIYELIDEVKGSMTGLLDKKKVERFLGRAEVRQTFTVPKIGTIAGSAVIDGKILRGANVRLLRDSRVIFEGKMHSLKRFKDDAKEVAEGFECGIGIENYNDIKVGDIIEAYQIDLVTPELNG